MRGRAYFLKPNLEKSLEEYKLLHGSPFTDNLKKCGTPNIHQTPRSPHSLSKMKIQEDLMEQRGSLRVATVPVTPAIIHSIYGTVGIRICDLPATKNKILKQLIGLKP
jgi:CO/xanthine dehydrogenase Mo-binding subunit